MDRNLKVEYNYSKWHSRLAVTWETAKSFKNLQEIKEEGNILPPCIKLQEKKNYVLGGNTIILFASPCVLRSIN